MALQHEEAHGHGRVPLFEEFVVAGDEFVRGESIALGLGHLAPVDGEHVAMDPELDAAFSTVGPDVLGNLAFVVGKLEVHATAVDVKRLAEVFGCLLYTSPSPRDGLLSRMPSSA